MSKAALGEQILHAPETTPVPSSLDAQLCLVETAAPQLTTEQIDAWFTYAVRLEHEATARFIRIVLGGSNATALVVSKKFAQYCRDHHQRYGAQGRCASTMEGEQA